MAARMHRLEVRNESQAVAIAKLKRQLRELLLSRTPQHGVDGDATGEEHGHVGGDGGPSEPANVEVMGGDNAGTHDSMRGAHGEGSVADVDTQPSGNVNMRDDNGEGAMADSARSDNEKLGVRDEGAEGLLGTTDGNPGSRGAVGTGHGVTASNVDVDLVSAHSTGTETTSHNTTRGQAPSSRYTGISKREGQWAVRRQR
ncbi:unnamed protein product [Closterium sp. Yama58-4]|nr:unnamed protein product [Closterium sp. Yama58-4]